MLGAVDGQRWLLGLSRSEQLPSQVRQHQALIGGATAATVYEMKETGGTNVVDVLTSRFVTLAGSIGPRLLVDIERIQYAETPPSPGRT